VTFQEPRGRFGEGIAVEVQYMNKQKDIDEVESDYLKEGYSVLWLYEEDFSGKNVSITEEDVLTVYPNVISSVDTDRYYPEIPEPTEHEEKVKLSLEGIGSMMDELLAESWLKGRVEHVREKAEGNYPEKNGEWPIENKGCQNNDYFQGYTKEPEVTGRTSTRKPDVAGVRYEEDTGKKTPSFSFDYYFVEVKSNSTPGNLNEVFGQIDELKRLVETPGEEVAARNSEYYIALENEVPSNVTERAKQKGYGILRVDTHEDSVVNVREQRSAETIYAEKETVVANSNQQSPGVFRKEVEGLELEGIPQDGGTMILKHMMDPDGFFENELRPLLD
jgi:hypothetical protein